jgi:serine/threonine-protein kinase
MLTGRLPFKAANSTELARMHRDLQPVPPAELNHAIPETVNDIVMKVLSKEPAARYRTADQLGRVLQSFTDRQGKPAVLPDPEWVSPESATVVQEAVPPPLPVGTRRTRTPEPEPTRAIASTGESDSGLGIDWMNVFLGLLAIVAVGGLIPFWIWVYFVLNGPP